MGKHTLQSQREFYSSFMGESPCNQPFGLTIKELDESIAECKAILWHFIDLDNKEEISYWRKCLQEYKVQRRMLIA